MSTFWNSITNLEQLGDVVVLLGGGLHERDPPGGSFGLALDVGHFAQLLRLVALVAHQHDRNLRDFLTLKWFFFSNIFTDWTHRAPSSLSYLELPYEAPDGLKLLQALLRAHRVHQDEGMSLGDGKPLHGRELVRPGRIGDLQCAYVLIAANHLCHPTWGRKRQREDGNDCKY